MTTTQLPSLLSRRAQTRLAASKEVAPKAPAPKKVAKVTAPKPTAPVKVAANKVAAIQNDSRARVASAWTAAKTLLPTAPHKAQLVLAKTLCAAPSSVVGDVLRSTARLAYFTKAAEKFEAETKTSLNEFVDDESLLNKLRKEVLTELKQDEGVKVAGKTKKAGPEDMPPVDQKQPPVPPSPTGEDMPSLEGEDTAPDPSAADYSDIPPPTDGAPGEMGANGMAGDDPASPANEANDVMEDASLMGNIENVEREIGELESMVEEAGDDALDLASIFNPEVQAEKSKDLANEGDEMDAVDPEDYTPSDMSGDLEDNSEFGAGQEDEMDFFKEASAGPDPFASLLGKQAADVDVAMGDMGKEFAPNTSEDRDAESDHEGLLAEVLMGMTQQTMKQKRDTECKLETPDSPQSKAAKKKPVTTVGTPRTASTSTSTRAEDAKIVEALFRDRF